MSTETFSFVGIGVMSLALTVILGFLFIIYSSTRQTHYDEQKHVARLETYRQNTENQIAELTARLIASEERWNDVNHLLVSSQRMQPDSVVLSNGGYLSQFLKGAGLTQADMAVDDELVFVLTPFNPSYENVYSAIVRICSRLGLRAVRGDESLITTDILSHILRTIVRSRIVIAVIDSRNPNVYYELGLAHALDKPTILVSKHQEDVPFDIKSKRIVFYTSTSELTQKLTNEITRAVIGQPSRKQSRGKSNG